MFKIKSEVTGKEYEPKNCVFIRNVAQASKYLKAKAELLDLTVAYDNRLTFVFSQKDTYNLYQKWSQNKL